MVVGTFGPLTFETSRDYVFSLSNVKREYQPRYDEHLPLGAKPQLEFLAPGLQVFSFAIHLSCFWGVDIKGQLAAIKAMADEGKAERLIIGGTNYGYFVIEKAVEDWKTLVSTSVALTLKEYVV